jgi:hypothetical protein
VERPGRQSLARIVVAIERHRREMTRLLAGLDGIERVAVSAGVPTLAERRTDVSTLVSQLAGRLRMNDVRLGRPATELDGRMSSVVQNQPQRGDVPC